MAVTPRTVVGVNDGSDSFTNQSTSTANNSNTPTTTVRTLYTPSNEPEVKTYQFELNNFQKGNLAPVDVKVGTNPEINGVLLDNVGSKIGFSFMIPLDWDNTTDMQFMAMVAIPTAVTATVGNTIDLKLEHRVTKYNGLTKLDDVGFVHDTNEPQGTAPFGEVNDNVILSDKNTQYFTYMPHVIIPNETIGGTGAVFYGELSLKDIGVGKVSSIILYQMHINYKGFKA